ncbi:MAG: nicotinate (nicotinamide) nucleotide adenylyltransferase [Lachnospiraceae bacterium]|nr:nicotinate (nicotinamide) nucleotide adenylyltransferase [Lachnospiraceae bacterium]
MKKIGILGGTFDPIHIGHMEMAKAAYMELGLDMVYIIPTGFPYFKGKITPYDMRCEMVRLAIEDFTDESQKGKWCDISYVESDTGKPTYTYITLEKMRKEHPGCDLYFLCGTDVYNSIGSWKNPEKVLENAIISVFDRPEVSNDVSSDRKLDDQILEGEKKLRNIYNNAGCVHLKSDITRVSSTMVREYIRVGKPADDLVSVSVSKYIRDKGLYRE